MEQTKTSSIGFLTVLETVIQQRLATGSGQSYTAQLAAGGDARVAQKVGEEAVELALATAAGSTEQQLEEAADLVYHLLVLLHTKGLSLADVADKLEERHCEKGPDTISAFDLDN